MTVSSSTGQTRRTDIVVFCTLLATINCLIPYVSAFIPPRRINEARLRLSMAVSASKTGGRLIKSAEQFSEFVTSEAERPVLVFYTAPWCGPCRLSIPVVKEVVKQFSGKIEPCEVCTDDLPEVAADAGVVSIPTIHIYFNGRLVDTIIGCVAKSVLASSVEKVLEDVDIQLGTGNDDSPKQ